MQHQEWYPSEFAEGLREWAMGEQTPDAEAARQIVADTILMARAWLKAQFKDK